MHTSTTTQVGLAPRVLLRAGAALEALLLIVTPPAVLLALVGSPLDPPAALRTTDALTQQIDDATVVWLIALPCWLLWLHLLGSIAIEVLRQSRGSTLRMPLPGLLFGANSLLASHLVATLLLSGHATSSLTTSGIATSLSAAPAASATTSVAVTPPTPDVTTPRAVPRNAASVAVAAAGIECRVLPPEGRHHDTLWDIAERHLDDGTRWREIFALNEGREMPDGHRLTQASLVYPGWILRLPADAKALAIDAVPTDAVPTDGTTTPPGDVASPTEGGPLLPQVGLPVTVTPPIARHHADPPPPLSATPAATPPAQAEAPVRNPAPVTDHESDQTGAPVPAAVGTGLLGLAAAGLLTAVTRRRKVAARRRPVGTRPATPAPELRDTEAQLRKQARSAADIAAAVRLTLLLAQRHAPDHTVAAVWHHHDDSLELVLRRTATPVTETPVPAPPAPFHPTDRGWLLPADSRRYLFATSRNPQSSSRSEPRLDERIAAELATQADPFPLLLPVGTQDGSSLVVNLEPLGLITVTRDRPDDLLQDGSLPIAILGAWAQQLAGAPWAELAHVAVAPALSPLAGGSDRIDVLSADLLASLQRQTLDPALPADSAAGTPVGSLEHARRTDPDGAGTAGPVVLLGVTTAHVPEHVLTMSLSQRSHVTVLLTDPHPDAHSWQLHSDGTVTIPTLADRLVPTRLDPDAQSLIARLLEHAQDPPHASEDDDGVVARAVDAPPTPPADAAALDDATEQQDVEPEPTAVALRHAPARPEAAIDLSIYDSGDDHDPQVEGVAVPEPGTVHDGADTMDAAKDDPPVEAGEVAHGEAAADVASTATAASAETQVRVDVLGPVSITGTLRAPRDLLRQLLVYLALHRRPILPEALWAAVLPDRPYHDHVLRSRCSDLKKYLHGQLEKDGRAWFLPDAIRCDWQEFRALAAGDETQQLQALALVRGRPFEDVLDEDWIHLEGHATELEASIVDLALDVATRALDRGDSITAGDAAAAGLKASPYEERLYQLAMKAASQRGAHSTARALHRQLRYVLDEEIDPDDSEQPSTRALVLDLLEEQRTLGT
jgi:nucleoid-associated protein YgaU/DNA-binding SARP family transcriptional activator